jgi:hypothetical protein
MTDINNVRPNPMLRWRLMPAWLSAADMLGGAWGAAPAGASMMGADRAGNFTYEDSAGNPQSSAIPYRRRWPKSWGS